MHNDDYNMSYSLLLLFTVIVLVDCTGTRMKCKSKHSNSEFMNTINEKIFCKNVLFNVNRY